MIPGKLPLPFALLFLFAASTASAKELPADWPRFEKHKSMVKVSPPLGGSGKTQKFALLVGIETYGSAFTKKIVGQEWPSLEGALNDLQLMARELRRRGFEVAILANENATRDGIVQAMGESLYMRLKEGRDDVALLYFAGHGQQVADVSGDEPDGFDEAMVTYDNNGVEGHQGRLLDDDLGVMLRKLAKRAGNVVVLMDSCHSGGSTRGANTLPAGLRPRGGHMPLGTASCGAKCKPDGAGLEEGARPENLVFLSATQSHQLAYEAAALGPHGAFTYYFTQALNRMPANATYARLMGQVRASMSNFKSVQWPGLEGDASRVVFGAQRGEEVEGFWVRKDPKSDDIFVVDGSPASGVMVGAILQVRTLDAKPGSGVRLRVEKRRKGEMVARPMDRALNTLRALGPISESGGIGRVVSSPRGLGLLTVDVSQAPPKVREALERQSKIVRVATKDTPGEFTVVSQPDGQFAMHTAAGTPLPLPVCFDAPMQTTVAGQDAAVAMLNGLQYEQRRRRLIAFGGRGRPRGIKASFRVKADAGPLARGKKRADNQLAAGQDGSVSVTNSGTLPFYPYLVEVANDGTVNILHPNVAEHEASQAIQPGQTSPPNTILITAGALPGNQLYVLIASKTPIDDIDQLSFFPSPVGGCEHHPPSTRGGRSRKGNDAPWTLVTETIEVLPAP